MRIVHADESCKTPGCRAPIRGWDVGFGNADRRFQSSGVCHVHARAPWYAHAPHHGACAGYPRGRGSGGGSAGAAGYSIVAAYHRNYTGKEGAGASGCT